MKPKAPPKVIMETPPEPLEDTCYLCMFFFERMVRGVNFKECRRYPTAVDTSNTAWCGEYKPKG